MPVHFSSDVILVAGEVDDCQFWEECNVTEKAHTLEVFKQLDAAGVAQWVENLYVRARYPSDDLSDSDEEDEDEDDDDLEPAPPIPTEGFIREEVTGEELLDTDEFTIDDVLNRCDIEDARHLYAIARSLEKMRDSADDDGGMWESVAQMELFKSKHGLGKAKLHIDPELDKVFQEVQVEIEKVFVDVREHSTWRSANIVGAFERVIALSEDCIRENHLKPKQEQVIIDAAQGVRHRLDELLLIEDCIPEPGEQLEEDEIENLLQEVVEVVTEANDLFLLVNLVGCMKVMAAPRYEEVFDAFETAVGVLEQVRKEEADIDTSAFNENSSVATVGGHLTTYEGALQEAFPYVMNFPKMTADVIMSTLSLLNQFEKNAGGGERGQLLSCLEEMKGYINHMLVSERGHAAVVDADTADESIEAIQKLVAQHRELLTAAFGVDAPAAQTAVTALLEAAPTPEKTDVDQVEAEAEPRAMSVEEAVNAALNKPQRSPSSGRKSKKPTLPPAVPVEVAMKAAEVVISASSSNVPGGDTNTVETTPPPENEEVTPAETGADKTAEETGAEKTAEEKVPVEQTDEDQAAALARDVMRMNAKLADEDEVERRTTEPTTDAEEKIWAVGASESSRLLGASADDEDSTCWQQLMVMCFGPAAR